MKVNVTATAALIMQLRAISCCHGFSILTATTTTGFDAPSTRALTKDARFGDETMDYHVRPIATAHELYKAQELLYTTYVEQCAYSPVPGNPSQWKAELRGDSSILVDKFDSASLWVGAFTPSNELMGVARIIGRDSRYNNKLEMEEYDDLKSQMETAGIPAHKYQRLVECNRFAIVPKYRDAKFSPVFWSLIMFGLELAEHHQINMVSATPFARILARMAGARKIGSITYDPTEARAPTLIFFDEETAGQSVQKLAANYAKWVA